MFKHSDPSDLTDEEAEQIVRDNQEREKQEKEKGSNATNTKAGTTQTTSTLIKPISITDLIESNPDMRPVVIDGILRRGETANIIAAAKVGKTYLVYLLAWCIVTGMSWLSHVVKKGRVLIIDNELHPETLANRLDWIAQKLMIEKSDYIDSIDVVSLRGQNIDIHGIEHRLATIEPGTYSLAIVDALYRTLPVGTSENDNAAMMQIYNKLDHYASKWDCAIAVVHHASKGQQGDKAVTDVGAGAGSISRAADTHIVIRPHENPDLSVLECVTRSFKSPPPVSIRFDWPLWNAVATTATVKKATQPRQDKQAEDDKKAKADILEILKSGKPTRQQKVLESSGFGNGKTLRILALMANKDKTIRRRTKTKQGKKPIVFWQSSSASSSGVLSEDK